jgi:NDP-sugar pyrophosphorylase family protein
MRPLTDEVPKALASFSGGTLLGEQLRRLLPYVDAVHVTVGHLGHLVAAAALAEGVRSVVSTEGQGNAWWVVGTPLGEIDEPTVVITCDNLMDIDLAAVRDAWERAGEPPCMVVPVTPEPETPGDFIRTDGTVVTSLSRHEPSDAYCSGLQVVVPARLPRVDDFTALWGELIEQRQLHASDVRPERWFAVDTMAQLDRLDSWVARDC